MDFAGDDEREDGRDDEIRCGGKDVEDPIEVTGPIGEESVGFPFLNVGRFAIGVGNGLNKNVTSLHNNVHRIAS